MGDELEQLDWLDAKLRDEMPYIDDAGFTANVVQKLPTPARASRSVRAMILLLAAVLASVIAFVIAGPSLATAAAFLFTLSTTNILVVAGTILFAATIAGGTFAFSKTRDSR
ncbi:MAG TPA: hypothetical protein VGC85_00980 [Chthoniobacterales bacterium]|jgi:hypothetical protein